MTLAQNLTAIIVFGDRGLEHLLLVARHGAVLIHGNFEGAARKKADGAGREP